MNDTYSLMVTPTESQIQAWADVSGDHNPVHSDGKFASSMGLPGPIVQGQLVVSVLLDMVDKWVSNEGYIVDFSFACRNLSLPNVPLICKGNISARNDRTYSVRVSAENPQGQIGVEGLVTVQMCH